MTSKILFLFLALLIYFSKNCFSADGGLCVGNLTVRDEPRQDPLDGLTSIGFNNPYKDRDGYLMDPGLCIYHCADYEFTYAALQKGNECRCGGSTALITYAKLNDTLSKTTCNLTCVGNQSYICGGDSGYTIYQAVIPIDKQPQISATEKVSIIRNLKNDKRYDGCIRDSPYCNKRVLNGSKKESSSLTIDDCIAFCKDNNYKYAGLEIGSQCFCDNSYDSFNMLNPEECSSSCIGNKDELCGGPLALSIYTVPPDDNRLKIGLGVGIPLFVLVFSGIGIGLCLYCRNLRKQKEKDMNIANVKG
ncbi:11614_t:CDS:2 [Dentiscutata heterogama]|uniref:11614_t:CDS:1 n=1 Tax=Dentiscutata heterogama TaxID=1316150 RepID=A0ACA9KMR0_9GLOM|nr:11614_t:CDS:2 [Dentiscutata heterogama]